MGHRTLKLLLLPPSQYTILGIKRRSSVQWAFELNSNFWLPKAMSYLVLPQLLPCSASAGFPWLGWELALFKAS